MITSLIVQNGDQTWSFEQTEPKCSLRSGESRSASQIIQSVSFVQNTGTEGSITVVSRYHNCKLFFNFYFRTLKSWNIKLRGLLFCNIHMHVISKATNGMLWPFLFLKVEYDKHMYLLPCLWFCTESVLQMCL